MVWKSYRFRFLPWIVKNFKSECKRVARHDEFLLESDVVLGQLRAVCEHLDGCLGKEKYEKLITPPVFDEIQRTFMDKFGFCIRRQTSWLKDGGLGVIVSQGTVPKHHIVGIYPGAIYRLGDPIFLQSIGNSFVFRCSDGTMIDGNNRALSRLVYSSSCFRDRAGPQLTCDLTWLSNFPANPLNVGQFVNNQTNDAPANITYQELDLPLREFHPKLRRYIPNVPYAPIQEGVMFLRMVVLISLREIQAGEELYATYFTMIG